MKYAVFLCVLMTVCSAWAEPVFEKAKYTDGRQSPFYTFYYDKAVSADGERTYRIITGVPKTPAPEKGYRAVYAVDGNAVIHHIKDAQLEKLAKNDPPVIVAIGYDADVLFHMPSRTYDFTPSADGKPVKDGLDPSRIGGGAVQFIDFIEKTVFPLSETRAHIDRDRRTLFGHSYGGLFVLSALSERPRLFSRYVSADPSLWWQEGAFFKKIMQAKDVSGISLIMMKGASAEGYLPTKGDSERVRLRKKLYTHAPKDAALEVVRKLSAEGMKTQYREYGYLSHGPLFPVSLDAALSSEKE
ncbi:MAG: alpha/beta hydrolase [Deferribacterales bacterium]